MDNLHESYEIIFINDGSIPAGIDYLENKMDKSIVRIINPPKHVGQVNVLASGKVCFGCSFWTGAIVSYKKF
jgi:hypothetical protein